MYNVRVVNAALQDPVIKVLLVFRVAEHESCLVHACQTGCNTVDSPMHLQWHTAGGG